MLQAMRTGAKSVVIKTFLFGLLILATIGLALVGGQGASTAATSKNYVAKIGRDKISTMQFDNAVQNALRENNVPRAEALGAGIPQMVLQQEINARLFSRATHDLGLIVDDATAARQIKSLIAPLIAKGTSQKDALQQFLRAYGLSEAQLVGSIKAQTANDLLVRVVSEGVLPPKQMVGDALQYKYETRQGEYFFLTEADAGKIGTPTDADLEKTYAEMKNAFMQPESRSFAVLVADRKALGVSEAAPATEADAKAYYESHIKEFTSGETRTIRQSVVKDEEMAKRLATEGLKTAGTAKILTGTYKENDLPEELSKPIFAAEAGAQLQPVKSPLGWHVISVDKINPATVKSFDSIKADLLKKVHQNKAAEALYARADEIDNDIADGKSLADIAQQLGVKETVYSKITADKKDSVKGPMADKVFANAFALSKGEVSQLIEAPNGEFVLVEVREINAAAPKPLSEVRDEVATAWRNQQIAIALNAKAGDLMARLKGGESLEKIAAAAGKKLTATGMIQRADKTALPARAQASLFAMENNGEAVTVPAEGKLYVLRMTGRKLDAPETPKKEDLDMINGVLKQSLQRDVAAQYRLALMKKYKVEVYDDVLTQLYSKKSEENQP